MIHTVFVFLLALALAAAGARNLIGGVQLKADYLRWGYPAWWNGVTGAVEIGAAALTVVPSTRGAGMALAALVIAAAAATLLRRREFAHLAPLGPFAVLIACAAIMR